MDALFTLRVFFRMPLPKLIDCFGPYAQSYLCSGKLGIKPESSIAVDFSGLMAIK